MARRRSTRALSMRPPARPPSSGAPVASRRRVSAASGGLSVATGSWASSVSTSCGSLPAQSVRSKPPSPGPVEADAVDLRRRQPFDLEALGRRGGSLRCPAARRRPGRRTAIPAPVRLGGPVSAPAGAGRARLGKQLDRPRLGAERARLEHARARQPADPASDSQGQTACRARSWSAGDRGHGASVRKLVVGQDTLDPGRRRRDVPGHEEHGTTQDQDQEHGDENASDGRHDSQRRSERATWREACLAPGSSLYIGLRHTLSTPGQTSGQPFTSNSQADGSPVRIRAAPRHRPHDRPGRHDGRRQDRDRAPPGARAELAVQGCRCRDRGGRRHDHRRTSSPRSASRRSGPRSGR